VPEIIASFAGAETRDEPTNASTQTGNGPLGKLSEKCLELTEEHFDRVQVGRIFGQIAKCCACGFNRLSYARDFVSWEVVCAV
jgi:hypothetical protein